MPRPAAPALLLGVALLIAGCLGGTSGYQMSAGEQQLKQRTLGSLESVETYTVEGTVSLAGETDGVSGTVDGVVNRTARTARTEVELNGAVDVESTTYVVNDTAYVNARGRWQVVDVADRNLWDRTAQLERQREIFEGARFELVGNDTVDGERVRVVRVHVPEDNLDDLLRLARSDVDGVTITEATYTASIDAGTDRLRRVAVDMTLEGDGRTVDARVRMTFREFGRRTAIDVPEEAPVDR